MIKDILVNLNVSSDRDAAEQFAVSIAGALDAHIAGTAFAYAPVLPLTDFGGGAAQVIDMQRDASEAAAKKAMQRFEALTKRNGVSAESRMLDATVGGAADTFGRTARRFDLSVVQQVQPEKLLLEDLLIEGALFESGRPVIIVPYIQKTGLKLDRIMCCWDGGRAAARAIADAMPFLTRAKGIDLVIIETGKRQAGELPGSDMAEHLARHGVKVDIEVVPAADVDVPEVLLSHAADTSADMIVMGGYGHSRLREFVLGGTTREILKSMTVPTLMSH
jgi:nucleotide-binding universal stress UspA family protein